LISRIEGRTQTYGALEYVVEEDIWSLVGQGIRGMDFRKLPDEELCDQALLLSK
jgi:hypothetical protein